MRSEHARVIVDIDGVLGDFVTGVAAQAPSFKTGVSRHFD